MPQIFLFATLPISISFTLSKWNKSYVISGTPELFLLLSSFVYYLTFRMQRTPAEKDKDFQKIYFTFSLISAKFSFFLYIFCILRRWQRGCKISFKPVTGVIPCIPDQQHYYFAHSDLWMGCQRHSLHCILYFLDHGISICLQRWRKRASTFRKY